MNVPSHWSASWLEWLSNNFDRKQSRESLDLLLTCHPFHCLFTFIFWSSEVRRLLLDSDSCSGTDPSGLFSRFLKRTTDVLAPHLSVVFWWLLRLGNFRNYPDSNCCVFISENTNCFHFGNFRNDIGWRQANVTPIPKGSHFYYVANYWQISVRSEFSKVHERLVSFVIQGELPCFQPPSFFLKVWVPSCDALFCVSRALQNASQSGHEPGIFQFDFRVLFDRDNHQGILNKFCSVGSGGSLLSTLTQFLLNIDSCQIKLANVLSGVPQGSVLSPLLFLLYT